MGSSRPFISVIMAVFKEPKDWIKDAIDSILNQTFTNFEFIIINDNPDNSELQTFLNENKKTDKRIKIVRNKKNLGLTKSLNIGLLKASGSFIARMDADDISNPERFEVQLKYLDEHPEIVGCGSQIKFFGKKNKLRKFPVSTEKIMTEMIFCTAVAHPTLMIRHDFIKENNLNYNEDIRFAQDYDFLERILNFGDLGNIPRVLLNYRISDKQISLSKKQMQSYYAIQTRKRIIESQLKKYNISFDLNSDHIKKGDYLREINRIIIYRKNEVIQNDNNFKAIYFILLNSVSINRRLHALKFIFSMRFFDFNLSKSLKLILSLLGIKSLDWKI